MTRLALLPLAALATGLAAQSNVVAGLDGRLTVVNSLTYYGRRGPAHPNGEVGMAMLNTMCNPGSVNIPWYQAMQPNHPKFGFLIVRVAGDRIEQINEWSFCKHAFVSINVSGACGSCQDPGTGSLMGLNCSDTYAAGNNANRRWLGPPEEIDPWLGTWQPVGSYFDIGDPMQAGYPLPADGIRSLDHTIFDTVQNRVTVDEADLLTPNASYYYGLQLIHEGEALANRDDNLAHRGFNPVWNGGSWSFPNNAAGQQYGSILDRWPGANVEFGHDGGDNGRFFVASKVTPLGGGLYHYEYAVHNVDNSRGGGTLRIPIDAGATASNFTFGDIDLDPSNDWTAARVGNEVVFTSPQGNPLEWNTIYNFGFDADVPPGVSTCEIDHARPGVGSLWVEVQTEVPGGSTIATFATFGAGCAGSTPPPPVPCPELNGAGGTLTNDTNAYEYTFRVPNTGPVGVAGFEIFTAAPGGPISRAAHVYADVGGQPSTTPLATTTITVGTTPGFYAATFPTAVAVSGAFYVGYENSPGGYVSNLTAGQNGAGFYRVAGTGTWAPSSLVQRPSWRVSCATLTPAMGHVGLPQLGASYDLTLTDALGPAFALLVSGLSDSSWLGAPLPAPLPNAPGCDLLVSPDVLDVAITSPSGAASSSIAVPNAAGLVGLPVFHQWAVLDAAANPFGIVVSNGGRATVGN